MSENKTPLILGFITLESNEINMLKSVVRFARQNGAQWRILCLKEPESDRNPAQIGRRLHSLQAMSESMGGEFSYVENPTAPDYLKLHLFEQDVKGFVVTRLMIDHTVKRLDDKYNIFHCARTLPDESDCVIDDIDTFVPRSGVLVRLGNKVRSFFAASIVDLSIGLLYGFFAILIAISLHYVFNHYWIGVNNTYIYLIFIIFANLCALQAGVWGGLICTMITSLGLNYFFMNASYGFSVEGFSDLVNWVTFVITAASTSAISALMMMQYRKSELKEKNLSMLLDINASPLKHKDVRSILADLKSKLHQHLQTDIIFFVPTLINENKLEVVFEEDAEHNDADLTFVNDLWTDLRQGHIYSYKKDPATHWVYLPLSTMSNDVGVLAIKRTTGHVSFESTLDYRTLSEMIASILEYVKADQQSYARDVLKEKDKLRMHIMSSVSHDLKTPLASIIGSLGLYMSSHNKLKEQQVRALVDNAYAEANRLDGFVTNILAMTKLEAGLTKFRIEKTRPSQLVNSVMDKIRWRLLDNRDRISIENVDFVDLISVDMSATELTLINLLDNALRHSLPDMPVLLRFDKIADDRFTLTIINKGATIPAEEMNIIFDKYNRLHREDSQQAGTGLGLALCNGLMRGQNGEIVIRNMDDGVAFVLTWPPGSIG
ncbi:MAG TPA: ATP-binding protein [Alphaproteobacteria bacterium]